ncbi:MAG: TauD/TfdA family dioxygenase [Gammaproteobacteria bacterium]
MTPIHREIITHPIAWRGSDFRGKDDLAFDLGAQHVAALEEILLRVEKIPRDEIRREHCGHPALDADMARIMDEIMNGRGLVIMRGMPVANHSVEDLEKMYWALGTHFGTALSQNSFGMLMSRVQEELRPDGSVSTRGTKSRHELAMHIDEADIFGLMCIHPPREGGETQFASVPAIHNAILQTRPDVLPILYKGFPHHRRGEQPDDQPVVSPYDCPVFCNVGGVISGNIVFGSIMAGLHVLGRTPTAEEIEALDLVQEWAIKLQFEIKWEAGDIAFANNYAMFHSRSDYVDWDEPERKRLLLRYWLELPKHMQRPIVKELHFMHNKDWRPGIDAVPGRSAMMARSEYLALPESVAKIIQEQQQRRKLAAQRAR